MQVFTIKIKPLSANAAWKGKRFKTDEYEVFEQAMLLLLPRRIEIPEGNLALALRFGFSNPAADIDNPCKMAIDCLQKKYGFNDKRVYGLHVEKTIVPKGQEFIEFAVLPHTGNQ